MVDPNMAGARQVKGVVDMATVFLVKRYVLGDDALYIGEAIGGLHGIQRDRPKSNRPETPRASALW